MTVRVALLALAMLFGAAVLPALGASIASSPSSLVDPYRSVVRQIEPSADLVDTYPGATQVGAAIAVVPNPLVPRYRRLYDLTIQALELGMLRDGYVLDRFSLPWNAALQSSDAVDAAGNAIDSVPGSATGSAAGSAHTTDISNHGSYGLLIFRCDGWRGDRCGFPSDDPYATGGTRIRALYVVTDTATYGVPPLSLRCAVDRIQSQLDDSQADGEIAVSALCPRTMPREPVPRYLGNVTLLRYPGHCNAASDPDKALVVLGPNFSGAFDSFGRNSTLPRGFGMRPDLIADLCLVSFAATATTNAKIEQASQSLHFTPTALPDYKKIFHIRQLISRIGLDPDRPGAIAILAEASTFGYGVCDDAHPSLDDEEMSEFLLAQKLCHQASSLYFPATISDIRYGVDAQRRAQQNELASTVGALSVDDHLSLESGAENGSEYPDSRQSGLTSASLQLTLDQVLDRLQVLVPRVIIVVATDVRDRLFLFNQLRARLPRAMLVDLEADNLLTHPEFLHASRGAMAVASAHMFVRQDDVYACEQESISGGHNRIAYWPIDGAAMLYDGVSRLYDSSSEPTRLPCQQALDTHRSRRQGVMQTVTLKGFYQLSFAYPDALRAAEPEVARNNDPLSVVGFLQAGGPLLCVLLSSMWWTPLLLASSAVPGGGRRAPAYGFAMPSRSVLLRWLLAVALIVVGIRWVTKVQPENALWYWLFAVIVVGGYGVMSGRRRVQEACAAARQWRYASSVIPGCLALLAILLAAMPYARQGLYRMTDGAVLDGRMLMSLALDVSRGLAYFPAIALGVLTLLYASLVLTCGAATVNQTFTALASARSSRTANARFERLCDGLRHGRAFVGPLPLLICGGLLIGAAGIPYLISGDVRITVFGLTASRLVLAALTATTLAAALLTTAGVAAVQRISAICGYVRETIIASETRFTDEYPGLWESGEYAPTRYAATPVLARRSWEGSAGNETVSWEHDSAWSRRLGGLLHRGDTAHDNTYSLFIVLVAEMSLLRSIVVAAAVSALASVGIQYLFPIEADVLLLMNLVMLAFLGALCAYAVVTFEANEVLSHVLCNRKKKVKLSIALVACIALPFVATACAIAVTSIPGVLDWSGGLLQLLQALGIHP